jgi:hypothetical protein
MKKNLVFTVLIVTFLALSAFSQTRDNLILAGSVNVLLPADSDYTSIYGDSIMLPEFSAFVKVTGDWFAWAGYGFLDADGTTPVFGGDAKSSQDFLFAGAAYRLSISEDFKAIIRLGAGSISYKEDALESTIEDSAFGFLADCSLFYNITDYFSLFASAGYISGSDTVADEEITLGGFKVGGGLAVNF